MRRGLGAAAAVALALALGGTAQAYEPPRTADGKPQLSGVWSNASLTSLTRPRGVTKLAVGKAEADAIAKANPMQQLIDSEQGASNLDDNLLDDGNSDRGYNAFWIDPGKSLATVKGEYRTSWIVEPASGQLPLSEAGRAKVQARQAARREGDLFTDPESLPLAERCLIGFSGVGGPGMLNPMYNNNYSIVQTPDAVLIQVEMVHDARIVRMFRDRASARHRPAAIRPWLGDSVGWWEGDTLVVETMNVHPEQGRAGPIYLSDAGKVTERFTRVADKTIHYEFTVEDPNYYTQAWRAEMPLNARDGQVYEYACHEGNYAMAGILGGARSQEAQGIKPSLGPGIFGTPIPGKTGAAGGR